MSDRRLLAGAPGAFALFLAFLLIIGGPPESARTPLTYPGATALVVRAGGGAGAPGSPKAVSFHTSDPQAQVLDY